MNNLRSKKAKWFTFLVAGGAILFAAAAVFAANSAHAAPVEFSPAASAPTQANATPMRTGQAVPGSSQSAKAGEAIPAIRTLTALYKPENAQQVLDQLTRNHPGVEFKIIADGSIVRADTCEVIYVTSAAAQVPGGAIAAGCTPTQVP
jgi:hypothetical protein